MQTLPSYYKAYRYAKDVVNGEILAGKYIIKACNHFLDMTENKESKYYEKYFINYDVVKKIDNIVKLNKFSTGEYAGQNCYKHICGFQWFILINLYCIFHRDNTNKRRYEKACVFIARKNAKTWLVSMFMLLALLFEPNYAQLVASANTRDQARILFNEIKKTLEVSPALNKHFKIQRDRIECKLNNNVLFPIAAEARNTDGMLVSVGCVDEYGAARDDSIYQSLQTSMLSVINRLIFTISTGYPYANNPMRDQIEYGKKVLDELIEDDKFFLMCYELDEDDLWTDKSKWIKSNPLQATSKLGMDFLESECKMALEMPSKAVAFRTKNLNQWLDKTPEQAFMDIKDLKKCEIDSYDWTNKDVVLSFDLSMSFDNTAISILTYDYNLEKYVAQSWGFIPYGKLEIKEQEEKVPYRMYIENGWCFACGDRKISYSFIEEFIMTIEKKLGCRVRLIGYDKYEALSTVAKLEDNDFNCVEVGQGYWLHSAIKKMKEIVLDKEFAYVKNDLFVLNVANAREEINPQGKLKVSKKKSKGKIDLLASLLNGFELIDDIEETSVYETEGITFI